MVEGLAKYLRCVGIDAAVPQTRKPDSRELLDQALKENRVLLTRDTKLLRHQDLVKHQIYRVKSLLKNEQLLEVIETFQLKISGDQLMSRCTKCYGKFIQKPLSIEEAIEAATGFQRIPNCLFNKNLEFWQGMNCHQLYWEIRHLLCLLPSWILVPERINRVSILYGPSINLTWNKLLNSQTIFSCPRIFTKSVVLLNLDFCITSFMCSCLRAEIFSTRSRILCLITSVQCRDAKCLVCGCRELSIITQSRSSWKYAS